MSIIDVATSDAIAETPDKTFREAIPMPARRPADDYSSITPRIFDRGRIETFAEVFPQLAELSVRVEVQPAGAEPGSASRAVGFRLDDRIKAQLDCPACSAGGIQFGEIARDRIAEMLESGSHHVAFDKPCDGGANDGVCGTTFQITIDLRRVVATHS